jgi:hypothetical protein
MVRAMKKFLVIASIPLVLVACGQGRQVQMDEYGDDSRRARVQGRLAGGDGIMIFGTDRSAQQRAAAAEGAGLGVNAFLWRASLDTLSFMPLASADPFGGVIITDWYSPPGAPGERFRASAFILGRQLRSDGVRVTVFRQELRGNVWVDSRPSEAMNAEFEDRILGRARELRSVSVSAAAR